MGRGRCLWRRFCWCSSYCGGGIIGDGLQLWVGEGNGGCGFLPLWCSSPPGGLWGFVVHGLALVLRQHSWCCCCCCLRVVASIVFVRCVHDFQFFSKVLSSSTHATLRRKKFVILCFSRKQGKPIGEGERKASWESPARSITLS